VVGVVMVTAGTMKLMDTSDFTMSILAYNLVGFPIASALAHTLPLIEIAGGLCLLTGAASRLAAAAAAVLLAVFTAAIVSAWARGLSIDCGCFGAGQPAQNADVSYAVDIIRDLALMAACGWVMVWPVAPIWQSLRRRGDADNSPTSEQDACD